MSLFNGLLLDEEEEEEELMGRFVPLDLENGCRGPTRCLTRESNRIEMDISGEISQRCLKRDSDLRLTTEKFDTTNEKRFHVLKCAIPPHNY